MADLILANTEIVVETLLLYLFNTNNLLKYLISNNGCFCCHSLRVLYLSFNHLIDSQLATVEFPAGLKRLNLSNNQLQYSTNRTFAFQNLSNLRTLDLSNNNIMSIDIRNTAAVAPDYALTEVNLSGNFLNSYFTLSECVFFKKLRNLDLSRNL